MVADAARVRKVLLQSAAVYALAMHSYDDVPRCLQQAWCGGFDVPTSIAASTL
jgi:hypothetical protein